ncbi:basic salivary proline-rich protein 4-like [Vombatus ursinus]|uniref:basic salivary proline-rich protein 4-like n=1 Tax=Vombatus ursinus TaxID=29139 RepID=UPI000FFCF9C2|nr:basic salivary proline-rich protein 4-like [Vombatus ursinus]
MRSRVKLAHRQPSREDADSEKGRREENRQPERERGGLRQGPVKAGGSTLRGSQEGRGKAWGGRGENGVTPSPCRPLPSPTPSPHGHGLHLGPFLTPSSPPRPTRLRGGGRGPARQPPLSPSPLPPGSPPPAAGDQKTLLHLHLSVPPHPHPSWPLSRQESPSRLAHQDPMDLPTLQGPWPSALTDSTSPRELVSPQPPGLVGKLDVRGGEVAGIWAGISLPGDHCILSSRLLLPSDRRLPGDRGGCCFLARILIPGLVLLLGCELYCNTSSEPPQGSVFSRAPGATSFPFQQGPRTWELCLPSQQSFPVPKAKAFPLEASGCEYPSAVPWAVTWAQ